MPMSRSLEHKESAACIEDCKEKIYLRAVEHLIIDIFSAQCLTHKVLSIGYSTRLTIFCYN